MTLINWRLIALLGPALALAACASEPSRPTAAALPSSASGVTAQALVGKWGVAAFHREGDKDRTEREARAQCRNPYTIAAGKEGGVMMHLADEKEPFELKIRGGSGGAVVLGPDGAPDNYNDREILAFDSKSFITKWLDSEIAGRYGTTIYVRCGASGRAPAARRA